MEIRGRKKYKNLINPYIGFNRFDEIGLKQEDPFDIVNKYYTENVTSDSVFIPDHERAFVAFQSWFAGNRVYLEESEDDDDIDDEHKLVLRFRNMFTKLDFRIYSLITNFSQNREFILESMH